MVDPENCPVLGGQFGVKPDTTGIVLQTCGNDNDSECKFQASSLEDAVTVCNRRADICSMFSYDCLSKIVLFVDPNQSLSESTGTDLYTKQVLPILK